MSVPIAIHDIAAGVRDFKEENETPEVLDLIQENDATVLSAQLSSDELVNNEDISNTHSIILEGREELQELGEVGELGDDLELEVDDYEGEMTTPTTQALIPLDFFGILRRGAINLVLPFINGIMLGFGEIFAHEVGFRYGFIGARVYPPRRQAQRQAPVKSRYL